jgi:hypothetical protein
MKILATAFVLLLTLTSMAQSDREVTIDEFHTIKTFDLINVRMVKSDLNKLEIKGKNGNEVEYVFKNGLLKLRMEADKIFDGANTIVTVHYTGVKTIDANEGSVIYADDISGQDSVELRTQEGARIIAGLDLNNVDVRADTGGIVEAKGLRSENTDVKVQAGGEVEVYASESVNVLVRAGGNVMVYGSPKDVVQKTTFGGNIIIK